MRRGPFLALALLAAVGCGKKGPPVAPEPRGPFAPAEVVVRQVGGRVLVHFGVPPPKGPNPAQRPALAELERVQFAPGPAAPPVDPAAFRLRGEAVGQASIEDLEPGARATVEDSALAALPAGGAGWTLRYLVRLRDRRGRMSRSVITPDLLLAAPLPPPGSLTAEATADGVRLVWSPPRVGEEAATEAPRAPAATPKYNIYRWLPGQIAPERPLNDLPIGGNEYLDGTVLVGSRYVFAVRAILAAERPLRETESSAAVEIEAADRFPPTAPAGLVAVQEGRTVRLFWNPGAERDLAGYRVYRRKDAGPWERTGPDRVDQPSYVDDDVRVGDRLAYRVTAVDRAREPNESAPSEVRDIEVFAEPAAEEPRR